MAEADIKKDKGEEKAFSSCKAYKKLLSFLVDLLVTSVWAILFFLVIQVFVSRFSSFKKTEETITSIRLDSGLYIQNDDSSPVSVVVYCQDNKISYGERVTRYQASIEQFQAYISSNLEEEAVSSYYDSYESFFLDADLVSEGVSLFVKEDGAVVKNPACALNDEGYCTEAYEVYLANDALAFLTSGFASYSSALMTVFKIMVLLVIPLSLFLGGVITFYLVPLMYKRDRKTIGRHLFRISLADKNGISLKGGRFALQALAFILFHLVLAVYSFGLTLLISLLLVLFTPKHQSFDEFLTGVITTDDKDYKVPLYIGEFSQDE